MSSTPEYVFEKLTPVGDTDIKVYQSAIDFAFQESDVKNVAISGAYGAGKSSVLYTYEQAHEDKKFVHISLAHFQGIDPSITQPQGKQERKDSAASHDIETVLEGKIINQLIHQIPADSIPQTNFKVKKSIAQQSIWISFYSNHPSASLFSPYYPFRRMERLYLFASRWLFQNCLFFKHRYYCTSNKWFNRHYSFVSICALYNQSAKEQKYI